MKKLILLIALIIPAIAYATNSQSESVVIVDDEIPSHWVITEQITDLTIKTPENDIINYIRATFPNQKELAVAIARAESGLNTMAHGDKNNGLALKGSHGIFQINVSVHEQLIGDRNVNYYKDNIDIAREIYDQARGWSPWGAYTSNKHLRFLK